MLAQESDSLCLPELRQNLKLIRGGVDEEGARRWLIFDPSINKYFTLSRIGLDLMRHWAAGESLQSFVERVRTVHPSLEVDEVKAFIDFLTANALVQVLDAEGVDRLKLQSAQRAQSWYKWLVHNYLFIRIPLLKPDRFLRGFYPSISWLYQPWVRWIIVSIGLLGVLLTIRQWDDFANSFSYFFSLSGLIFYFLALVIVKLLHELGHAFTAYRQGCRVSSIGVAFIVLFPVLYTDTTDAWKLSSKYQKLAIVIAGVKVELYLALIATFFWAVLPDGVMRSVAFVIASTTWISSLLVNISPFLRFDGYYAFSDWMGSENLQSRSFAFGRWYLRELLFGVRIPAPEPVSYSRQRTFIVYAWLTWIYRFFLFLGIALLVYHFAFKVLGIILFLIEILWFILLPIGRELKAWWQMRSLITINKNTVLSAGILFTLIALLFSPWEKSLSLNAVFKFSNHLKIYPKEPGEIEQVFVSRAGMVNQGETLLTIRSDELDSQILAAEIEVKSLTNRLERIARVEEDKQQSEIIEYSLERAKKSLQGLKRRAVALDISSPITGKIVDVAPLAVGQYVGVDQALYSVVDPTSFGLIAYIPESQVESIALGTSAVFIADSGERLPAEFRVTAIKQLGSTRLNYPELASLYGGDIAVRPGADRDLIMEETHYEINLEPISNQQVSIDIRTTGRVVVEADPQSLALLVWRHVASIFVRELSI